METLELPPWTLSARLDNGTLEFCLGDGRRLAWRARQPSHLLLQAEQAIPIDRLLGPELAARLSGSAPRVLNLQLDKALDGIAWEALTLGAGCLAEHFAVARQLISDADLTPTSEEPLAEALALVVIHGGAARACPQAPRVSLDSLTQHEGRAAMLAAHVLVLDGVTLAQAIERVNLPRRERLLVLSGPQAAAQVAAALDRAHAPLPSARQEEDRRTREWLARPGVPPRQPERQAPRLRA